MPRFFLPDIPGETVTVTGSDAHHIGFSLRMKPGEELIFCRGGTDYFSVIESISESEVRCRVLRSAPSVSEPDVRLSLYQAYPKQDKLELIIQKTTELGAARIVPFLSARCIARPDEKTFAKKRERLCRIAEESAKQSGRGLVPDIAPLMSFREALADMSALDAKLFCYENGGQRLRDLSLPQTGSIGVMIGSEGGFERAEAEAAEAAGAVQIWLGKRILRCETCPIAVTAVIMNLTGNF